MTNEEMILIFRGFLFAVTEALEDLADTLDVYGRLHDDPPATAPPPEEYAMVFTMPADGPLHANGKDVL